MSRRFTFSIPVLISFSSWAALTKSFRRLLKDIQKLLRLHPSQHVVRHESSTSQPHALEPADRIATLEQNFLKGRNVPGG